MSKGQYDDAEELLLRVIQNDPFNARAHGRLGWLYWRTQRIEDALNSLTRALELNPEEREIVLNCAEVMRSYGRLEDARLVLNSYLGKNQDDGEVRKVLEGLIELPVGENSMDTANFFNKQGELQFAGGRLDHARACFEMAVEKDSNHADALSNLGIVEWHAGNAQASLELLYKAFELKPEDPDILFNCYEVLKAVGERESAAMLLQMYLRRGCGGQQEWDAYEELLLQSGAGVWSPSGLPAEVTSIYTEMGKLLHAAGDAVGAAQCLERAFQISPRNPEAHRELAQILWETGKQQEAVDVLKEGLVHDPSHEGLVLMMSRILVEGDQKTDATVALESALQVKESATDGPPGMSCQSPRPPEQLLDTGSWCVVCGPDSACPR
jgi:tetratricopeptide (TPR) repeat protein